MWRKFSVTQFTYTAAVGTLSLVYGINKNKMSLYND